MKNHNNQDIGYIGGWIPTLSSIDFFLINQKKSVILSPQQFNIDKCDFNFEFATSSSNCVESICIKWKNMKDKKFYSFLSIKDIKMEKNGIWMGIQNFDNDITSFEEHNGLKGTDGLESYIGNIRSKVNFILKNYYHEHIFSNGENDNSLMHFELCNSEDEFKSNLIKEVFKALCMNLELKLPNEHLRKTTEVHEGKRIAKGYLRFTKSFISLFNRELIDILENDEFSLEKYDIILEDIDIKTLIYTTNASFFWARTSVFLGLISLLVSFVNAHLFTKDIVSFNRVNILIIIIVSTFVFVKYREYKL